jgi:hypothetical protein
MTDVSSSRLSQTMHIDLVDFRAEVERRGGVDCKFVCPICGNEASPRDFKDAGAKGHHATSACIGRLGEEHGGCDWAAFGLFRGPVFVQMPGGGEVPAFHFAGGDHEQ